MKKILLAVLSAMTFAFGAYAAEIANYFVVNLKNGSTVEYRFVDKPTMKFVDSNVEITALSGDKLVEPISEITNFTFRHGVSGIEDVAKDNLAAIVTFDGNAITVEGVAAGASIGIYSISGMLCASAIVDAAGSATINVADLAPGVYVAAIPGHNFKFVKK